MEIRRNEATINRPEGDRVLDASYVFVDLDDFMRQLRDEKTWDKNDRNGITVYKTDKLTIVLTVMHKGASIPDNKVDGLFTLQVIEGTVRVNTVNGDAELKQHQLISFHSNEPHSITAVTEAAFLIWNYTGSEKKEDNLL
jgi:quercetin dioxygenase-like cupin family protein